MPLLPAYVYQAVLCVVMIATGQLLFKLTANSLGGGAMAGLNPKAISLLAVALVIYGAATLLWIYVLRQAPLHRIYPLMALSFVLVPLGSRVFLGESITPQYWGGLTLLIAGLVLISRSGGGT